MSDAMAKYTLLKDSTFINLQLWMKQNGFKKTKLMLANFEDTGRGLLCTKEIAVGEMIIAIPKKLLITSGRLNIQEGENGFDVSTLSETALLCLFLLKERYVGEKSFWKPYLDSIPTSYENILFLHFWDQEKEIRDKVDENQFWENVFPLFPIDLQHCLKDQQNKIIEDWRSIQTIKSKINYSFTFSEFLWSWFSICTRCVSFSDPNSHSTVKESMALAPMLDFLNHTNTAQVVAKFNPISEMYEIHTLKSFKPGEQVFIFYGAHDNFKLYIEYGFYIPKNQYNSVNFDEEFYKLEFRKEDVKLKKLKEEILHKHKMNKELIIDEHEISWKLRVALKIRIMNQLEFEKYWRQLIFGEMDSISIENDNDAKTVFSRLLDRKLSNEYQNLEKLSSLLDLQLSSSNFEKRTIQTLRILFMERIELLERAKEFVK